MTEVVINGNLGGNSIQWYHTRPLIERETVKREEITVEKKEIASLTIKKSLFARIKSKIFSQLSEKDRIIPVLPISHVKSKVYTKIGSSIGATSIAFRIN